MQVYADQERRGEKGGFRARVCGEEERKQCDWTAETAETERGGGGRQRDRESEVGGERDKRRGQES